MKQLGYCGILEATKISRAGFPARFEHHIFVKRYMGLIGNLANYLKNHTDIRKGKTKYYLKYDAFVLLEIANNLKKKYLVNKIKRNFKKWNLKRKIKAVSKIISFYRNIKLLFFIRLISKQSLASKKIIKFYRNIRIINFVGNISRKSKSCKKISLILEKNNLKFYFTNLKK